jgi:hypothetical protein
MTEEEYIKEFKNLDKDNDREMVAFASKVQRDFLDKNITIQEVQRLFDKTINTLSIEKRDYIADAIFNEEE